MNRVKQVVTVADARQNLLHYVDVVKTLTFVPFGSALYCPAAKYSQKKEPADLDILATNLDWLGISWFMHSYPALEALRVANRKMFKSQGPCKGWSSVVATLQHSLSGSEPFLAGEAMWQIRELDLDYRIDLNHAELPIDFFFYVPPHVSPGIWAIGLAETGEQLEYGYDVVAGLKVLWRDKKLVGYKRAFAATGLV